jgi:hypothetical protein
VYGSLIFTSVNAYAGGCYMQHSGFPRRTLLGSSVNKSLRQLGTYPLFRTLLLPLL